MDVLKYEKDNIREREKGEIKERERVEEEERRNREEGQGEGGLLECDEAGE